MGLRERTETYFRKRVRVEREHRGWSQEEVANRLTANGVPVYASTIAKIESDKKARAVRLDEAAALADLFDVSLDALLGRKGMEDDQSHAMTVLAEEAQRIIPELGRIQERLRRAYQDLEAQFDFQSLEQLIADGATWTWNLEGMSVEHRRAMLMWMGRDVAITRIHEAMLAMTGVLAYRAMTGGEVREAITDMDTRMTAMAKEREADSEADA